METTLFISLLVIFLVVSLLRYSIVMRKRKEAMKAMAMQFGLQRWPDDSLTRGLSLHGTPLQWWSKLFNVYEGILNHRQIAVLDLRKQAGKYSWSRTIVAVKTPEDVFAGSSFGLEKRRIDGWQLIYSPVGFLVSGKLMEVCEVEEILKAIGRIDESSVPR